MVCVYTPYYALYTPYNAYIRRITPYIRRITPYIRRITPYIRRITPYIRRITPYIRVRVCESVFKYVMCASMCVGERARLVLFFILLSISVRLV
jgi:hypothetical protein